MHQSKTIITALLALLVLLGGVYVWQKRQAEKVPPVPRENPAPDTPPTQQDLSTRYPQHIVPIAGTDEVWYQIPELGIQMRLNKEFAEDLVYESHGEGTSFQKKSILAASPQCNVESADSGYLYKINGTIDEADRNNTSGRGNSYFSSLMQSGMIMQLPHFFVALSTDRADACWWGRSENKAAEEAAHKVYDGSGHQSVYAAVRGRSLEIMYQKNK